MSRSLLDPGQIIQSVYNDATGGFKIESISGSFVPEQFDQTTLTYITSGNGTGEVGTVVYKLDGNTICTLTLTYDSSNRLIDVLRS